MNRAARRRLPPDVRAAAEAYQCPDCDNTTRVWCDQFGMWRLDVLHDDTCPWLRQQERRNV
jgi:hypothetical protein